MLLFNFLSEVWQDPEHDRADLGKHKLQTSAGYSLQRPPGRLTRLFNDSTCPLSRQCTKAALAASRQLPDAAVQCKCKRHWPVFRLAPSKYLLTPVRRDQKSQQLRSECSRGCSSGSHRVPPCNQRAKSKEQVHALMRSLPGLANVVCTLTQPSLGLSGRAVHRC